MWLWSLRNEGRVGNNIASDSAFDVNICLFSVRYFDRKSSLCIEAF
jgi:hypothetical protein